MLSLIWLRISVIVLSDRSCPFLQLYEGLGWDGFPYVMGSGMTKVAVEAVGCHRNGSKDTYTSKSLFEGRSRSGHLATQRRGKVGSSFSPSDPRLQISHLSTPSP